MAYKEIRRVKLKASKAERRARIEGDEVIIEEKEDTEITHSCQVKIKASTTVPGSIYCVLCHGYEEIYIFGACGEAKQVNDNYTIVQDVSGINPAIYSFRVYRKG